MKHKAFIVTVGLALVTSAVTVTGMAAAQAATTPPSATTGQSLAAQIAERFNLDQREVQKVIDESKQKPATVEQKAQKQLDAAVKRGDITAEQKAAILQKFKEMQQYIISIKDKPAEERQKLMEAKKQEVIQWAKDNGLGMYVQEGRHFKFYKAHAQQI